MTTKDFRALRARELNEFFSSRFGKSWRWKIRKLKLVPMGCRSFEAKEELAISLGFNTIPTNPNHLAFERNFFARLSCISVSVMKAEPLLKLRWNYVLHEWFIRPVHPFKRFTDVLPLEMLTFNGQPVRMTNPSLAKLTPSQVLDLVLASDFMPTPRPLAGTDGGHPAPQVRSVVTARNKKGLVSDYEI